MEYMEYLYNINCVKAMNDVILQTVIDAEKRAASDENQADSPRNRLAHILENQKIATRTHGLRPSNYTAFVQTCYEESERRKEG